MDHDYAENILDILISKGNSKTNYGSVIPAKGIFIYFIISFKF